MCSVITKLRGAVNFRVREANQSTTNSFLKLGVSPFDMLDTLWARLSIQISAKLENVEKITF